MLTTTLANTGLKVSRMGLGCGGHSRLGLARGGSREDASRVVRAAVDLGVNLIDTAEAYGTEEAVGFAIKDLPRESLVVSTKVGTTFKDAPASPTETRERVENCLKRLQTGYVDILHLHGVAPDEYPHALNELYPELAKMKTEGKIRHIGITEGFIRDPGHRMLTSAVEHGPWEVVMVGFSLLNPSARDRVLPFTRQRGIGTLDMFAVRRALSNREALLALIDDLIKQGHESLKPLQNEGLDFLIGAGVARSITEAAYRFCLWEPGIDVVLSGTGDLTHLKENADALQGPPLPEEILERLRQTFGPIDSVSGN